MLIVVDSIVGLAKLRLDGGGYGQWCDNGIWRRMVVLIVVEFFFPRFWFEVEESEEWVCQLCWFYLEIYLFIYCNGLQNKIIIIIIIIIIRQDWGLLIFLDFLNFSRILVFELFWVFNFCWQGHEE